MDPPKTVIGKRGDFVALMECKARFTRLMSRVETPIYIPDFFDELKAKMAEAGQ